MTLEEFGLQEENHFIAMEYYWLILNRTFLILLTKEHLIGLKVNGLVSAEGGGDPLTQQIIKTLTIQGDLESPYSYMKEKYLRKIINEDVLGEAILLKDEANFRISRKEIISVKHDPSKKWGMGYYPHDGKVYVHTKDNKQKEFIILGNQSGRRIKEWILKK